MGICKNFSLVLAIIILIGFYGVWKFTSIGHGLTYFCNANIFERRWMSHEPLNMRLGLVDLLVAMGVLVAQFNSELT